MPHILLRSTLALLCPRLWIWKGGDARRACVRGQFCIYTQIEGFIGLIERMGRSSFGSFDPKGGRMIGDQSGRDGGRSPQSGETMLATTLKAAQHTGHLLDEWSCTASKAFHTSWRVDSAT